MIHINSNAATLAVVAARSPAAFVNGLNRGLALTMQQALDDLRGKQFLSGVSAQIEPGRSSVGLGLKKPDAPGKHGTGHYAYQLDFAKSHLRYVISTNFVGALVHEFGAVIKAKSAKYLKFQVPSSIAYKTKLGKPMKKKVTGWRWVQVKEVHIPARPAWKNVSQIAAGRIEHNVMSQVARELNRIFGR